MSVFKLFSLGGVVMWPLLGFSMLVTALFLERGLFWWKISNRQTRLVQRVLESYPRDPQAALAKLKQNTDLPIVRIFLAALTLQEATPDEFRLALESAAQAEIPLLKRFNTIFETVIGVAPLLGLLGTILGLITSFSSLQFGQVAGQESIEVTAGVGEALISTATGLVVAIFTLLFANLFQGLYRRQRAMIQENGGRLEILYRRLYRRHVRNRQSDRK
ncbi:MAG: MotA/TolQ/ExbB proton channel family protein [Leptolyngbyaceae cyanobacterium MO_188.B28]|nr:MotA/TolQ/ExbB proton channel family protein [Leptolyngbyaceae cyanobacterium MO_188.B28]